MSTPDAEDQLMELLLRWDELRAEGQDPCGGRTLQRLPRAGCELSRRIRVLLALEPPTDTRGGRLGRWDRSYLDAWRPATATSSGAASSRFRRLRPHAKGGLGEVFVARDEELNREVALKEIQSQFSQDPVSRSRFLSEAEITGSLEHPGIVPVYGLGRHDDGRPFYAMRFIKGNTLKEAIEEFHEGSPFVRDPGACSSHCGPCCGD